MGYSENSRRVSCHSVASTLLEPPTVLTEEGRPSTAMTKTKGISPLERMVEIQSQAEYLLRSSIMNERARKWEKVVELYDRLLKLIARPHMPPGFSVTDSYVMLVYESYYHLGLALQNIGRHREAVTAFTQSVKAVNIHKNGCLAGCNSNSCFQTPVLAKRAFAHAKAGDMKRAFIDIEKAIVLDTRNSDLYCIRALLWNTTKDTEKAVDDLNRALRYNPCHVCALLLRGAIDQPFTITFNFLEGLSLKNNEKSMKKDHIKAQQICSQAVQFLDVMNIHSPKLISLWNRFLWSLNVPRNIVHPELMEGFNSGRSDMGQKLLQTRGLRRSHTAPVIQINGVNADSANASENIAEEPSKSPAKPFRCGTPTMNRDSTYSKRRNSYGEALRTFSSSLRASASQTPVPRPPRPLTANSVQSTSTRTTSPAQSAVPRPHSGMKKRPSVSFSQPLLTVPGLRPGTVSAPPSLARPQSKHSSLAPSTTQPRRISLATLPIATMTSSSMRSKRDAALIKQRSASEYAQKIHGMRVFQPLDVADAPRMYYKPWAGDKLPVADMKMKEPVGIFRV